MNNFQFLIYKSADEDVSVNAIIKDESIWLTQKAMAQLFDCSTDNISLHLKNIFSEGELDANQTTEKFSVVQKEGQRQVSRSSIYYSLDAIISVGYRLNSKRAPVMPGDILYSINFHSRITEVKNSSLGIFPS